MRCVFECAHVRLQACTRWWSSCCPSAWSCWCLAGSLDSSARWPAVPTCWLDQHPIFSSAVSPHRICLVSFLSLQRLRCYALRVGCSESFARSARRTAQEKVCRRHVIHMDADAFVCMLTTPRKSWKFSFISSLSLLIHFWLEATAKISF